MCLWACVLLCVGRSYPLSPHHRTPTRTHKTLNATGEQGRKKNHLQYCAGECIYPPSVNEGAGCRKQEAINTRAYPRCKYIELNEIAFTLAHRVFNVRAAIGRHCCTPGTRHRLYGLEATGREAVAPTRELALLEKHEGTTNAWQYDDSPHPAAAAVSAAHLLQGTPIFCCFTTAF